MPIRWSRLGAAAIGPALVCVGEYGSISGAKIATSTSTAIQPSAIREPPAEAAEVESAAAVLDEAAGQVLARQLGSITPSSVAG